MQTAFFQRRAVLSHWYTTVHKEYEYNSTWHVRKAQQKDNTVDLRKLYVQGRS